MSHIFLVIIVFTKRTAATFGHGELVFKSNPPNLNPLGCIFSLVIVYDDAAEETQRGCPVLGAASRQTEG
jgi:hypothetical protein